MKLLIHWKNTSINLLFAFMIVGISNSCHKHDRLPRPATEESADVVYAWYRLISQIQQPANPQPVVILNYRNFGYVGVGLYESVRPGIKGSVSLSSVLYQMPQLPSVQIGQDYLWSASANAALASMFKQFLAGLSQADIASIDSMEDANNDRFRLSISDATLNRSQAFGRSIATAIYNWSKSDNFNLSSTGYTPPVFPGAWVPTPPAFAIVGPYLEDSRPFLEYSLTALPPALPVPYSEDPASAFYKDAKELYDIGKSLTSEQKAIADWWGDIGGAGVGVPAPYHILSIITSVLEDQGAKLGRAVKVYAKTGIAFKDGISNTFRGKYHYNLLRPLTYINQQIDPNWKSYLVNPPYPEYTSGLMSVYAPTMQILIREFGDIPVNDDTYSWRGLPARKYASITELVEEAAMSRVYGGIHFKFTQTASIKFSKILGDKIADINLVPYKH